MTELITTQEILEFNVLKEWLKEALQVTDVTNDILKTLGLLTKKDEYTNAGAIVSDVNIYLGVDLARFGKSINEILDRETHDQISVLKMYSRALAMFERYYCYEVIEGYALRCAYENPRGSISRDNSKRACPQKMGC